MLDNSKKEVPPRLPLHIKINADLFNTNTTLLRQIWEEAPLRPHVEKFIQSNITKQRILLGLLFLWAILVFWLLNGSSGNVDISELVVSEKVVGVDLLANVVPTDGNGLVTAILLNWSEVSKLKIVVKYLCQYHMFKKILIWNNNVDIQLSNKMFVGLKCSKIQLYNSFGNMHFIARYMACKTASTPYCYFQDEDYIVRQIKSMYANFLRFPHLIHTIGDANSYSLSNWKRCFFDDVVNLHTCFTWLGYGAFASRSNVVKFLRMSSATELDPTETAFGDNYFTTFMNQAPYQLESPITLIPNRNIMAVEEETRIRNEIHIHKGLVRLYDHLNRKTSIFESDELIPRMDQRDVRAPCANDRCLFITNKASFPDAKVFRYRPYVNISESERIHEIIQSEEHFTEYPYSYAVDGNESTAWKSQDNILEGDYVGLDLLLAMPVPITVKLLFDQHTDYFQSISIEISYDGSQWLPLEPIPKISCKTLDKLEENDIKKHIHQCVFVIHEIGYRFVKLQSTRTWEFGYGLYELSARGTIEQD